MIEQKVAQINRELSAAEDGLPPVSLSAGVSYNPRGNDPAEMFRRADIALYHMKENGKNGCCFYSEKIKTEKG